MLVLDASVVAEFLIASRVGRAVVGLLRDHAGELHVPHLAIVETASVLRGWAQRGEIESERASAAVEALGSLPARRWPAEPFLPRIWELRENATVYVATYLALAEQLDAEFLTADRRLARGVAGMTRCRILTVALPG